MITKKIAHVGSLCVSCGACSLVCPVKAITMDRGLYAVVDPSLCVGCTKCEQTCPAGVITMEGSYEE